MQMQDNLALATDLYATFYGIDAQAVDTVPLGLIRPFIALLRAPGGTTASTLFATPKPRLKSGSGGNIVDQVASSSSSRATALASASASASASISTFRSGDEGLEDSELWVNCKVCDPLSSGFPVTIPHPVRHVGQFPLVMLEHLQDEGHQARSRGDQEMVVDDRSASPTTIIVEPAFASGSPMNGSVIDLRTPEPEDMPNIREHSIDLRTPRPKDVPSVQEHSVAGGKRKRESMSPEIRIIRHRQIPDDDDERYVRASSLASDGSPPPARPVFPDEIIRNIDVPGPSTRPLAIDDAQDEWMDLLALDGDRRDVRFDGSGQPIPEFEHLRLEAIARARAGIQETDGFASIAPPEVDAETVDQPPTDEPPELATPFDTRSDDDADVLIRKHAHITTMSESLALLGLQGRNRTLAGVKTPLRDSQVVAIANMRHYMRHPANPPKAGFFLCDAPRTGKTLVALTSLLDIGNELASGLSPTLILCSYGNNWESCVCTCHSLNNITNGSSLPTTGSNTKNCGSPGTELR
ncbi:hypothetical protein FFLO_01911 [Filobasidium floriforme]|uniref:Uncharacterized protein n=1 Tax=Filobasidium floriforme TaxID=5210 RepID=A0A8K0JP02_9TREE|nr:uncharacterized protein HD553DRAFT_92534 [Filobasidium floriforme]KAG7562644.1 hypothetical protein FFLO_01911 [Filobasidium floriforme]KAH8089451.1 hypothetical protein HD553DRAFT_92534 [Filobasidium floriforme]